MHDVTSDGLVISESRYAEFGDPTVSIDVGWIADPLTRTLAVVVAASLMPAFAWASDEPEIPRFVVDYLLVQQNLKGDDNSSDQLMKLAEVEPVAFEGLSAFWWAAAQRHCAETIEQLISQQVRAARSATDEQRASLSARTKENVNQCYLSFYYDRWEEIGKTIRDTLSSVSKNAVEAENATPPAPDYESMQVLAVEPSKSEAISWLSVELPWKAAAVIVAAAAAYISRLQYKVARAKFRHDVYERRFRVFSAVRLLLSQILQEGTARLPALFEYRAGTADAGFLFKSDVTDYIAEVDRRTLALYSLNEKIKSIGTGPERTHMVDEIDNNLKWLCDQILTLHSRFKPYMEFSEW